MVFLKNREGQVMPASWIAFFAGAILFFGGLFFFIISHENKSFVYDGDRKWRERNFLIVAAIGLIIALAGLTGIVLSIK